MRVLVTGGAGYIGSHVVVALVEAGHEPVIVDNLSNAREDVVDRIARITGAKPELRVGDIGDAAFIDDVVASSAFDAVMHFAGLKAVGESTERPLDYYRVNVGGATTLLRALDRGGVRRFVFSSSATVYGEQEEIPVGEDAPLGAPTNPYGRTKLFIEEILRDLAASDPRWEIGILRYFNPVGAHPSGLIGEEPSGIPNNLMPYVCRVAAGELPELRVFGGDYPTPDGTGVRDYIHVVDLAAGHVAALDRLASGVGVWNLGRGVGVSVLELVAAFEEATGTRVPYRIVDRRPGDVAALYADPSRAEAELGWKATRALADMCADAWRFTSGRAG